MQEKIIKLVAEKLNKKVEDIKLDSRLVEDLGADSLDVVELIMTFEDEFGVSLPDEEVEKVKEQMYKQGANVKKIYSSEAYNNLDIYQVNTTYYSALGNNDAAYLLARAIQFFAPGIPQVYYVGMLAGENDLELMERTKNGRDINRHYYSLEEIEAEQERAVVRKLKEMGIRKVEGKKLELYNYYTLCMFLDKVERGEKLN